MINYYRILEVNETASFAEIKSAYKKLAKKYHPDGDKNFNNEELFKLINEAYNTLSNENSRSSYDEELNINSNFHNESYHSKTDDYSENTNYNDSENYDYYNQSNNDQFYENLDKEEKKKRIRDKIFYGVLLIIFLLFGKGYIYEFINKNENDEVNLSKRNETTLDDIEAIRAELKKSKLDKENNNNEIIKGFIDYKFNVNNLIGYSELNAVIGNKTFNLISQDDELCIKEVAKRDFNNNGNKDILVEIINGCGGNCCGNSYKIFSFNGQQFIGTKVVGWDWNGIEVIDSPDGYRFRVENISEGVGNAQMCKNRNETYRMKNYNFELISVVEDNMLVAISEIKSSDFESREDDELFITYDLDNDGYLDSIIGSYDYTRWGRFEWNIKFGNGRTFDGLNLTKRIGIMNSKTNYYNDLVNECDEILKWNGEDYESMIINP